MDLNLEGAPTDDQKERLEDFLTELAQLTRKYRIKLIDPEKDVEIRDLDTSRLIGLGMCCWTARGEPRKVRGYIPVDSILDGVWLVDTPTGSVEQRTVNNVYPLREPLPER